MAPLRGIFVAARWLSANSFSEERQPENVNDLHQQPEMLSKFDPSLIRNFRYARGAVKSGRGAIALCLLLQDCLTGICLAAGPALHPSERTLRSLKHAATAESALEPSAQSPRPSLAVLLSIPISTHERLVVQT